MSEISSTIELNRVTTPTTKDASAVTTKDFRKKLNAPLIATAEGARQLKNETLSVSDSLVDTAKNSVKKSDRMIKNSDNSEQSAQRLTDLTPELEASSKALRHDAGSLEAVAKRLNQRADSLGHPAATSDRGRAKAELASLASELQGDARELRRAARRIDANIQRARRITRKFTRWAEANRESRADEQQRVRLETKMRNEIMLQEIIEEKRVNQLIINREILAENFLTRLEQMLKYLEMRNLRTDLSIDLNKTIRQNKVYEINLGYFLQALTRYLTNGVKQDHSDDTQQHKAPPLPLLIT